MIVYVDMDDVICDYTKFYQEAKKQRPEIIYPQSIYGFFSNLKPIDGAIETIIALKQSKDYEVYILTAPSIYNPLCYTEKRVWVEKWLGYDFVHRLIISPNKGLLIGDFLIDDHIEGNGQENFQGKIIQFGSKSYPGWDDIKNEFGLSF